MVKVKDLANAVILWLSIPDRKRRSTVKVFPQNLVIFILNIWFDTREDGIDILTLPEEP